jgi:hypothetical protein
MDGGLTTTDPLGNLAGTDAVVREEQDATAISHAALSLSPSEVLTNDLDLLHLQNESSRNGSAHGVSPIRIRSSYLISATREAI